MKRPENETTRSINEYAILLLKTSIYVNGASALALIAFIGNIWSTELNLFVIETFNSAITTFILGVWFAIGCLGLLIVKATLEYIFSSEDDQKGVTNEAELKKASRITSKFYAILILMFSMLSITMFPIGATKAISAFVEQSMAMQKIQDVTSD